MNLSDGYQDRLRATLTPYLEEKNLSYRGIARRMGAQTETEANRLGQRVYNWMNKSLSQPLREDAFTYLAVLTGNADIRAHVENSQTPYGSLSLEQRVADLERQVLSFQGVPRPPKAATTATIAVTAA